MNQLAFSGSLTKVAGAQALRPTSVAFPGTLAGSWITSEAAMSQTGVNVEFHHYRWGLYKRHNQKALEQNMIFLLLNISN